LLEINLEISTEAVVADNMNKIELEIDLLHAYEPRTLFVPTVNKNTIKFFYRDFNAIAKSQDQIFEIFTKA
jgi:hypothetical protein